MYGIRLLAPFSQRWFYGDALFIVDPWLWLVLGAGCWLARRARRWAAVAMVLTVAYALLLGLSGALARTRIADAVQADGGEAIRIMAAPLAVTPFTRWVVVEQREGYLVGVFDWLPQPRAELTRLPYETGGAVLGEAAEVPAAGKFLSWARFPFFTARRDEGGTRVSIGDARYSVDPVGSWASTSVRLEEVPGERVRAPR